MNTILIATDFSKASHNATVFGVQLAKAFQTKIILFHAYQVPLNSPDWPVLVSKQDIILQAEQELRHEVSLISEPGVIIETVVEEGSAHDAIISMATCSNADILIAGMKTEGKGIRKLFGNTITELRKETKVPLIVIPEDASPSLPDTIALASEIDIDSDREFLHLLEEISEKLNSTYYVVRVIKGSGNEFDEMISYARASSGSVKKPDPDFQYRNDTNVSRALQNFIKENNVGMLAMISHDHPILERIFVKSIIKEMIFTTSIPLIILPATHQEYQKAREANSFEVQEMQEEDEFLIY